MNTKTMNFIITLILSISLSFILPWWGIMVAAAITSFIIPLKKLPGFMIPFLAVFLFWIAYSYWLSNGNDFILAKKIAILLPLDGNAYLLILVTALIGGIAAGTAGIFGNQFRQLMSTLS
jgi:hypothetical protein